MWRGAMRLCWQTDRDRPGQADYQSITNRPDPEGVAESTCPTLPNSLFANILKLGRDRELEKDRRCTL